MNKLEIRKRAIFDFEDALIVCCFIVGVLLNAFLFAIGFWLTDNILQDVIIWVVVSIVTAYVLYKIFQKLIELGGRHNG